MSVHALPTPIPAHDAANGVRGRLSLKEAVILADVEEKPVRKDIESGILSETSIHRVAGGRLCVEWDSVFLIASVYGNKHLSSDMRKIAISRIDDMRRNSVEPNWWKRPQDFTNFECSDKMERKSIPIDRYVTLDLFTACHNVVPRVGLYTYGLTRIEERDDILGGEAVFKNSRLPVTHVGKCLNPARR